MNREYRARAALSLTFNRTIRTLAGGMRGLKHTHGILVIALLIVAIAAVLGHVCVLPAHAHAVPVDGHGSHSEDSSENSVHTASCDALKSASATLSIAPTATSTLLIVAEPISMRRPVDTAAAGGRAESPPLFLLHAALLI